MDHSRQMLTHPVDKPMNTITGADATAIAQPFVMSFRGGGDAYMRGSSVDEPLPTATAIPGLGLVNPSGFIVPTNHGKDDIRSYSPDEPLKTITSVDALGLAMPFLIKFYGTADAADVNDPLPTVTGKDRFALCIPLVNGYAIIDIFFRMLKPMELARAHSLGHYTFKGKRDDVVKQIGNGVPSMTAKHLCYSALI
jgi:DNA (cytosine-5)-methyltransferase 1